MLSRLRDASATCLICSDARLLSPARRCPSGAISKPNLVAITTLFAMRGKCLADERFVSEWSVSFSRIEECDATFDCFPDHIDGFLFFCGGTIAITQSHATEAKSRHLGAKFSLLHANLSKFAGIRSQHPEKPSDFQRQANSRERKSLDHRIHNQLPGSAYTVSIVEFRKGKAVHETQCFVDLFKAPDWRRQWVQQSG